jgi:uncharacterized protein Usg
MLKSPMILRQSPFNGFELVTTEVLYRMPDHPRVLNTFVWQTLDQPPELLRVRAFIDHWQTQIEAQIAQVRIACASLLQPRDLRHIDGIWQIQ